MEEVVRSRRPDHGLSRNLTTGELFVVTVEYVTRSKWTFLRLCSNCGFPTRANKLDDFVGMCSACVWAYRQANPEEVS